MILVSQCVNRYNECGMSWCVNIIASLSYVKTGLLRYLCSYVALVPLSYPVPVLSLCLHRTDS
jgi:hypothetical protein